MISTRDTQRRKAKSKWGLRLGLIGALLVLAAGLHLMTRRLEGPPWPPAPSEPLPIGPSAYEEVLARQAGEEIGIAELLSIAEEESERVEQRLDELALEIAGAKDWRPVFADLRREHPSSVVAVLELYRSEVARARSFVEARDLVPLPQASVQVVEAKNNALRRFFPLALYLGGRLAVIASDGGEGTQSLANHCHVCIPPLVVHETYPGHHVALAQKPRQTGSGAPRSWFFIEGWGQYAELLMLEQGYYTTAESELAAWQLYLLRIQRAAIDLRIHSGQLGRQEVGRIYRQQLLASEQAARAEWSRHIASPTVKTSYLVGALQILALRQMLLEREPEMSLRQFHARLLKEMAPIPAVARKEFGVELAGLEVRRASAMRQP